MDAGAERTQQEAAAMSTFSQLLAQAREEDRLPMGLSFTQEIVEGLDLSELEFRDAVFRKCRFLGCDFSGAAFLGCRLEGCDLSGCRLPGSFWRDCHLTGCKADGADFRRSRLRDTELTGCLFRSVPFTGGRWDRIDVKDCNFTESVLSELHLSGVVFDRANLTGAELFHTPLTGMDLTTCTLDGIVLSETCAELKGATIHASQAAVVARILGITVVPGGRKRSLLARKAPLWYPGPGKGGNVYVFRSDQHRGQPHPRSADAVGTVPGGPGGAAPRDPTDRLQLGNRQEPAGH